MVENHVRSALVPLYPRLRRFAVALTGSRAEGDDLVQHACERALARTYQWHPGTRLDSWLYRIIQNTWADERKSARNRTQAPIEAATNAIGDDGVRRAEARLTLDNVYRELCNLP
jgi:RNA polymerase sigma-70 factor (ECF subfamily)